MFSEKTSDRLKNIGFIVAVSIVLGAMLFVVGFGYYALQTMEYADIYVDFKQCLSSYSASIPDNRDEFKQECVDILITSVENVEYPKFVAYAYTHFNGDVFERALSDENPLPVLFNARLHNGFTCNNATPTEFWLSWDVPSCLVFEDGSELYVTGQVEEHNGLTYEVKYRLFMRLHIHTDTPYLEVLLYPDEYLVDTTLFRFDESGALIEVCAISAQGTDCSLEEIHDILALQAPTPHNLRVLYSSLDSN